MGVEVNIKGVRTKLSPEAMKRGRYALADMNPFVPRKSNTLRATAHLKNDGSAILYETKYAKRQFYLRGKNYSTPGTGPRWDLKAKRLYGKSWKRAFLRGAGIN